METIETILTGLGYNLVDRGKEYRARPIYRNSNNDSSLKIDKQTGKWNDFGGGLFGTFYELVKLTLGLKSLEEARQYLATKNFSCVSKHRVSLKTLKTFDLPTLQPYPEYWVKRGISEPTLAAFQGGLCSEGVMKNRYVFPIFNSQNKVVGLQGRLIKDSNYFTKYKIQGEKSKWCYPLFLNLKDIRETGEVILVEGIPDCLSLYECGIKNSIVLFGNKISNHVICTLLKLNLNRIVISLNNEPDNNNIGNIASQTIKENLTKHFDTSKIVINLPPLKDFNDMLVQDRASIKEWHKCLN